MIAFLFRMEEEIDIGEESTTYIEENEDILLQHVSPLFITEHKYLKITFWVLVVLVIISLLATLGYYIALNWV